ncbi:hypothetical protein HY627_02440 [Candidatus Uhrbacteria bacterium]|nr:hypothetical protein [Candidatus Uhrbacteria bacterium]
MRIIKTKEYLRSFDPLPANIQRFAIQQEQRFEANPRDPRLHAKRIQGEDGIFSFRITRAYRGFFYFHSPDEAVFFEIDHRKDAYR